MSLNRGRRTLGSLTDEGHSENTHQNKDCVAIQWTYLPDSASRLYTAVLRIRARGIAAVLYCSMEAEVSRRERQRANREHLDRQLYPLAVAAIMTQMPK